MFFLNKTCCLWLGALGMVIMSLPTHAWRASGGGGSGSAYGSHGGSASWSDGSGSAHGANGGSAAWSNGSGYAHGANGGYATWSGGSSYSHGGAACFGCGGGGVYRPPVYYGSTGYSGATVAAAGVAGLAVGAMVGAAAASNAAPTTVIVQQPMAPAYMPLGTSLSYLPGGCNSININSGQYYQCGPNWFRPFFGSNGAYYQVVPAPY